MENPQLYLASRSPRRRTLIEQLGIRCQTVDVDVDERPGDAEKPADYVARLAIEKARKGWERVDKKNIPVVGADTCIVMNGHIIGKVESHDESKALLQSFSARQHQVLTGIAVVGLANDREETGGENVNHALMLREQVRVNITNVFFRSLTEVECDHYWHTGEPLGKAGGYAIQGIAGAFIQKIEGSYSGVMGLPLCDLSEMLSEFGIPVISVDV